MPSKRRIVIFFIVLAVMMLAKYAHGQASGGAPSWDNLEPGVSDEHYIANTVADCILCGIAAGLVRSWARHFAMSNVDSFDTGLIRLRLT